MSRRGKNNHYHYAELFTDRARRRARRSALLLPRKAVFFAVLVLLAFGVISTTFASNNTYDDNSGGIIVRIRNAKVTQDYVAEGLDREEAEAKAVSTAGKGDFAATGADNVDLAVTGAAQYYYRGNDNSWGATAMTVSTDSSYEYYESTTVNNQFKISISTTTFDYNKGYVDSGFNSTDISTIGDYGGDNCYVWGTSGTYYIIVYYPNTVINNTSNPKICASTTLPASYPTVKLGEKFTDPDEDTYVTLSRSGLTYTGSASLTGGSTEKFFFVVTYGNNTQYFKDLNGSTMTYNNCSNWTFKNGSGSDPQLTTVTTGSYNFTFIYDSSSASVSVTYPKYSVTRTINDVEAATFTTTTTQVSIGSSASISAAPAANTGFSFEKWEVTSGTVKTGSYASGTNFTDSNTNAALTLYPYGTETNVVITAKYKRDTYTITYAKDDPDLNHPHATSGAITGNIADGTKEYNRTYTIPSGTYTRDGFTQVAWATTPNYTSTTSVPNGTTVYACDGTGTYSGNASLTLYPVWRMNSITKSNNTSQGPKLGHTSGTMLTGQSFSLGPLDISAQATYDTTRTYTYNWTATGVDQNDPSVIVSYDNGDFNFTTNSPGVYDVTVTITDTCTTGTTNGPVSATTDTATITVSPNAPSFTVNLEGFTAEAGRDGTTQQSAYMVMIGSKYYFYAEVSNPVNGYTYTFSRNSDFSVAADIVGSFTSDGTTNRLYFDANYTTFANPADTPDPRSTANTSQSATQVQLYCRISHNNQYSQSSDESLWYFIQPLIESFDFVPYQTIYNSYYYYVDLAADYNFDNAANFTTQLFFSKDNKTYNQAITAVTGSFLRSFINAIQSCMYFNGPKYFYMNISGTVNNESVSSGEDMKIHTTVGTADSTATRPLYFYNTVSGCGLKDYLVMCYYIDGNGDLGYQAAQDMYKEDENKAGMYYRVNIPADTSDVRFGFLDKQAGNPYHYYGLAGLSGGVLDCTGNVFKGYTAQVALVDSTRVITSNTKSDVNGQWSFNASSSAYTPVPVS